MTDKARRERFNESDDKGLLVNGRPIEEWLAQRERQSTPPDTEES